MNLIETLKNVMQEVMHIKNLDEYYSREVFVHLENGETAIIALGLFCANFEEQELYAYLNGKLETFKFSEVRNCVIIP